MMMMMMMIEKLMKDLAKDQLLLSYVVVTFEGNLWRGGFFGEEPGQSESGPGGLSTEQQQQLHQGPLHRLHLRNRNHFRVSNLEN